MKLLYYFTPLFASLLAITLLSHSSGVANIQGKDRTGSPLSDNGCIECHSGGSFSAFTTVSVTNTAGDTVVKYEPGNTYFVNVLIDAQGASKFGYQLTAMHDDTSKAGLLDALSPGTAVVQLNGFEFSEHTSASNTQLFVTQWIAPSAGKGGVTFYASSIAANGDGSTSGDDFGGFANVNLGESGGVGINQINGLSAELRVYPNPTSDYFTVKAEDRIDRIQIYALNGSLLLEQQYSGQWAQVNIENLQSGTYVIRVFSGEKVGYKRIFKL